MWLPGWAADVGNPSSRPDERWCRPRTQTGVRSEPTGLTSSGRDEAGGARTDHAQAVGSDPSMSSRITRVVRLAKRLWSSPRAVRCPRRARGSALMGRLVYELRVRGPVPPELLEEIGAEDFGEEPPLTVLRTEPTDQPGLHGLLQRVRSLGLDLIEVRTAAPDPSDSDPT